jgi:predicted HTH domain antitoxin
MLYNLPIVKQTRTIIRYVREQKGLSVAEASRLAGVKKDQWHHFELRGRTVPSFFGKMCRVLDLDPVKLLEKEGIL